jgi:glucosamine-6-phosphate deaminase
MARPYQLRCLAHPTRVRGQSAAGGRASGLTGIVTVVPVSPRVLSGSDAIGAEVAALVVDRYRRRTPGRQFLLGCPGGRSLASTYAHLAGLTAGDELDLSDLVVVMMDEYVEATDGGFRAVDPTLPHSCRRFG